MLVSRHAIENNVSQVVGYINMHEGPRVLMTPNAGYGLFADKDYSKGECVTQYGGRVVDAKTEGSYVMQLSRSRAIDGYCDFVAETERGRWINDAPMRQQNVHARILPSGIIAFVATKAVAKGEEFLWNYGPDYQRHWDHPVEACITCGEKPHVVEESDSEKTYCGESCQWIHYDLVGYNATEEVWEKLIRDVSVHDIWRVCTVDKVLWDICNHDEFKRRYIARKGADVEFFLNQAMEQGWTDRVQMWAKAFLEVKPKYANRRGMEMWIKKYIK